jgi:hypothetical protein
MAKTYRLIAPIHPAYPALGQRVILQGPDIGPLRHVARQIIQQSPDLATLLHILETESEQEPTGDYTIHIPTVIEMEPTKLLLFWADAKSVFGRSLN